VKQEPNRREEKNMTNKPEKTFRAGAVSATIWKNHGKKDENNKETEYNTIAITRSYTDKDGKWQNTDSFRVNDLAKVSLVASKAFEYLMLKEKSNEDIQEEKQEEVVTEAVIDNPKITKTDAIVSMKLKLGLNDEQASKVYDMNVARHGEF
jgi:hypothetical protein